MNVIRVSLFVSLADRTITSIVDEHLTAKCHELTWLPVADVIVCPEASPRVAVDIPVLLAGYPGCLVVAGRRAGGECVVATRDGQVAEFMGGDPSTLGSIAHAWTLIGMGLDALDGRWVQAVTEGRRPMSPTVYGQVRLEVRRDRRR